MTQRDGSAKVAEALRESPPPLDELARARMEKRLVDAVRAPRASKAKRTIHPAVWAGGSALLAAAAALVIVRVLPPRPVQITIAPPLGEELEVSEPSQLNVGHAEVALAAESAVRFESIETRDVRLALTRGAIDVAFHPVERGAERLSIDTPSARVEVVGTVFRVEIEGATTHVSVTEGTVRVVPHAPGAAPVLVHAGESQSVTATALAALDLPAPELAPSAPPIAVAAEDPPVEIDPSAIELTEAPVARAPAPRVADVIELVAPPIGVPAEPAAPEQPLEIDLRVHEAPTTVQSTEELPTATLMNRAGAALAAGRHAEGRELLSQVVRRREGAPLASRIEAQIMIGDSHQREGDLERAIAAYELAARLGRRRADGANAIFALARLYETHDRPRDARETYVRYLQHARGPNAAQAIRYLCQHDPPDEIDCRGARP